MEANFATEMSFLLRNLEDGQSQKRGDCVCENVAVVKRLETVQWPFQRLNVRWGKVN